MPWLSLLQDFRNYIGTRLIKLDIFWRKNMERIIWFWTSVVEKSIRVSSKMWCIINGKIINLLLCICCSVFVTQWLNFSKPMFIMLLWCIAIMEKAALVQLFVACSFTAMFSLMPQSQWIFMPRKDFRLMKDMESPNHVKFNISNI